MAFREYHQLDASVYLRVLEDEIKGDYGLKSNYLSKLGRTFGCSISIHILGEIVNVICRESKNKLLRDQALIVLGDFIKKQNIEVQTILEEDIRLFHELRELDYKSDEPEMLALAIDINKKANVFMTLDEDLLNRASLFKQKYGIKVRKPI